MYIVSLGQRLFVKQAVATLVLALLLSLATGLIRISEGLSDQRASIDRRFKNILQLMEEPAEQAAYRLDESFAAHITGGLLEHDAIYQAELIEETGKPLSVAVRPHTDDSFYLTVSEWLLPEVDKFDSDLVYSATGTPVGSLTIRVDRQLLMQGFLDRALRSLVLTLLKDLLLAFLISWVFYSFVTRPLQVMTRTLTGRTLDISKPLPLIDLPKHKNDELGALSHAFDHIWRELQQAVQALERSDAYSRAIISQAGDALFLCDEQGDIRRINREAVKMLGYSESDLSLLNLKMLHACETWDTFSQVLKTLELDRPQTIETLYQRRDQQTIPVEIRLIKFRIQDEIRLLLLTRDISQRKEAEAKINHLAYYDSLTQLPNRQLFLDRLEQAFIASREHDLTGALLFIDLDRFKNINDALGHDLGDRLLRLISTKLQTLATGDTTIARQGGDEFVFLLPQLNTGLEYRIDQVTQLVNQVRAVCSASYSVEEQDVYLSCSIGITLFDGSEEGTSVLLKQASTALNMAKDNGRNTYRFFEPEMQAYTDQRLELEKGLHNALDNHEFELYFQPQNGSGGELIGAEALIRWHDQARGFVPPAEFIPLAEEIGLITDIGDWVMEAAFQQLTQWQQQGVWSAGNRLSINVSPLQFQQRDFVLNVEILMAKYQVPGENLDFELTENMLISDLETSRKQMKRLQQLGIKLSIDDFGTGYSSLQYLKALPIDRLKVDQSFVRDLLTDPGDAAIVYAVVAMARALGLEVIAEGVETEAHVEHLKKADCPNFQGYYFGRPVPALDFCQQHLLAEAAEIK
ncbi:MAG: putative bifunctional diguanylate cyclase/phosphodiesterase [Pontibacterium sp.]